MGTDIARITLYFDLTDEQESSAAHFLEKMGRKKTKVIAKIVDDFIRKSFSNTTDIDAYRSADVSMFLRTGRFPNMVGDQLNDSTDLRKDLDDLKRIVNDLAGGKSSKLAESVSNSLADSMNNSDTSKSDKVDILSEEPTDENNLVNEDMDLSLMDGFF